ncbi:hypothetical protein CN326_19685 [Bacillus sp. AFS018417]|nr:hypothetical protein CN326_19685 [Bacillus sp. AFS018417]
MTMHKSGQSLFLPHARMKTKGESKCRSCFLLHSSGLYVKKLKWIYILLFHFIGKLERKLHLQNVQGIAQFKVEMNCHCICKNISATWRMYVLFGCFVVS